MGGYSYPVQIPQKIFACGGPKIVFFVFLKLKIFRLRRAKNHVLCVFRSKIFSPAAGTHQTWFLKTFLWAQERASAIHRTIQQPRGSSSMTLCFHECRNALLLFVKQSRRWQLHRRRSCAFTSVGTRFYYSQNNLTAAQTQFLAFHECRNALLLFAK